MHSYPSYEFTLTIFKSMLRPPNCLNCMICKVQCELPHFLQSAEEGTGFNGQKKAKCSVWEGTVSHASTQPWYGLGLWH